MGRQTCPSCSRHWTPPGPCDALDGGEPCGYREPELAPGRHAERRATEDRFPVPADGHAAVGVPTDPQRYLTEAREALAAIRARKGDRRERVDVETGGRL